MIFMAIQDEVKEFLGTPFNRNLVILLLLLGAFAFFFLAPQGSSDGDGARLVIHYFYSPTCPHCAAQAPLNDQLKAEFPDIAIIRHDVSIPSEYQAMLIMAQNRSIEASSLGTPTTFIGGKVFIGYDPEAQPDEMRLAISDCLDNGCVPSNKSIESERLSLLKSIDLPFLGKADVSSFSLPVLAIVLGLIDGFNPCAMWVLVYLISLLMGMNDRRRMMLVAGSFVLASGILYFLFMTAWLNAFLFLGYVRIVTVAVGLVALGGGILSFKEYIDTKGAMVCKVSGADDKKKMAERIKEVVSAPMTWATLLAIIALAFAVNSVEFVCSSAIPAVFTQVLALSGLPAWQHYGYILLYDIFFMLDDMLVFGSAVLVYGQLGEKYMKYCKIIGGAILLILGLMLLFAPQLLQ